MSLNLTYEPSEFDLDAAADSLDGVENDTQEKQEKSTDQKSEQAEKQSAEDTQKAFIAVKAATDRFCNWAGVDVLELQDIAKLFQAHKVLDAEFNFKPIYIPPKVIAICVAGGIIFEVVTPRVEQFRKNRYASKASAESSKRKQEHEEKSEKGDTNDE